MTNKQLLGLFLTWLLADAACLAIAKPQSWLFNLGMRGLPLDLLLGMVILGLCLFREG